MRIYVGAQQTEQLAFSVLAYSLRRHSSLPISLCRVDNSLAPTPTDPRFLPYTNFSYGRFAIPQLAEFQGRAIYLDSDMLVFCDIAELWQTPFDGAAILVEQGSLESSDRTRFTAVMLLDCAALAWNPADIVAKLGHDYDYDELMSMRPLLAPGQLADRLPHGWNSLDERHDDTRLLHYTKLKTQPWASPAHPLGQYWIEELQRMLTDGAISADQVRAEVAAGHVRPSLLAELGLHDAPPVNDVRALIRLDRRAGYQIHAKLFADMATRRAAQLARERELDPDGYRRRLRRRQLRRLVRHPLRFILDPTLRR